MQYRMLASLAITALCSITPLKAQLAPAAKPSMPPIEGISNHKAWVLAFHDEFNGPLDIAPGTGWGDPQAYHRWSTHTPYGGDFGDAWFIGPNDGGASPFSVSNGILSIQAWYDPVPNHWKTGLLSSIDYLGEGFATVGVGSYWECRMKMPKAVDAQGNPIQGLWPAFFIDTAKNFADPGDGMELDVCEYYSGFPKTYHTNTHFYGSFNDSRGAGVTLNTPDLSDDYHVYGLRIGPKFMTFYLDNRQVWQQPTPPEAYQPLYLMIDLALGGGWDTSHVPNPSVLQVDYVRVWTLPPGA